MIASSQFQIRSNHQEKIVLVINEQPAGVLIYSRSPENADEYTFGLEMVDIGLI